MNQVPVDTNTQTYRMEYRGTGEGLFGLVLQNFILRVLTLNIYYPWAKTEFRKHVWANTFFQDQALVYRGLGIEIFKGLCKVLVVYIAYMLVNGLSSFAFGRIGGAVCTMAGALFFLALLPRIILGAYRYRNTRTTWRGVRFGLKRIEGQFTWMFIKGFFLTLITLGFYAPVFYRAIYKTLVEAATFGNLEFSYKGVVGEEYMIYVKGVIFSILTLGIYSFWFKAELTRYRMSHTYVGSAVLSREVTGYDFVKMEFFCALALIFTLGIAFPWVFVYRARLICSKTLVIGAIDFENIVQSAQVVGASGEAASEFFDLDDGFFSFDI
jgi:uncharacterized membrane protein YjgN (DUF898 family)